MHLTKRQKEILEYIDQHKKKKGYAPSLREIGRRFGLSSPATIHKHLKNLEEKKIIERKWNRARAIDLIYHEPKISAVEIPLLGYVSAGKPIEAVTVQEGIAIPENMLGKSKTYVLRVKGDSMIEDSVQDGDFIIVEEKNTANNGEMVIAMLNENEVTLKRYYREKDKIRLQPANQNLKPIFVQEEDVKIQGIVIGLLRRFK